MRKLIFVLFAVLAMVLTDLPAAWAESSLKASVLSGQAPQSLRPFWHGYPWKKIEAADQWTAFLFQSIERDGKALLQSEPGDITFYCPAYPGLDREERSVFWARFISVLAELESTYEAGARTKEAIWGGVVSTGLLMLSLKSTQQDVFQCGMIERQSDLEDWRKNIACAVRMMSFFMSRDGVLGWYDEVSSPEEWTGLARYWGPLRDPRLKSPQGRMEVAKLVSQRRAAWRKEGLESSHPARKDEAYRRQGEKRFERLLRLMNAMPICYSREVPTDRGRKN